MYEHIPTNLAFCASPPSENEPSSDSSLWSDITDLEGEGWEADGEEGG